MSSGSSPQDVVEIVPPRSFVCIPGDAVVALGPRAVVGLGTGFYTIPYSDSGDSPSSRALVFSKYCAPVEKTVFRHSHMEVNVPRYSIESPSVRRYLCRAGDPVIGVIVRKFPPHFYYLFIGGTGLIYMNALAFDGATKTSHPRLTEGSLVYGFIKVPKEGVAGSPAGGGEGDGDERCCADHVDIEMSCAASELGLPPKEWTSREAIFGGLEGGRLLTVPLSYAKSLVTPYVPRESKSEKEGNRKRSREEEEEDEIPASYLINLLGQRAPFEVCIGLNGMVWVKGQESSLDPTAGMRRTVAVSACIVEGQRDTTKQEMEERVNRYFPH